MFGSGAGLPAKPDSLIAINFMNNKTDTIGVIIPNISDHFFSKIISGIQEIAFASDYTIMISQTNSSIGREVIDVQNFLFRKADGLIICPIVDHEHGNAHLEKMIKREVPLVFIDRADEKVKTCKILVDDFIGAYNAVA